MRRDESPLAPFRATTDDPWDREKAAHLARRAGFGAGPDELQQLVELGPEAAVDRYADFGPTDPHVEAELRSVGSELDIAHERVGSYGAAASNRIRRWWLFRMVHGRQPLQEKLTLFWHDHFACQETKVVRTRLLVQQNELFRKHAGGPFRELVREVARNPAMLVFLDNRLSEARNPNENWARELLELFTLGVDRYTQRDVTELARVFTGWTTPKLDSNEFAFRPDLHDPGDKELFGERIEGRAGEAGIGEGLDAIDRLLAHPDCARFLAGKLLAWFASAQPPAEVVDELADALRGSDFSIREALRTLFRSAWFYAPENRFALYRNPVELVVGVARALGLQNAHLAELERYCLRMGMELFEPPSVAGWSHGEAWAQTGSVAPRFDFAIGVSQLPHAARRVTGRASIHLDELAGEGLRGDVLVPSALVQAVAQRVLEQPLAAEKEQALVAYLNEGEPQPEDAKAARRWRRERIRACIHLILTAPELAFA
ncbi:MAG: DUF1800 domain-containing protein [Planctomycetota bacterium]